MPALIAVPLLAGPTIIRYTLMTIPSALIALVLLQTASVAACLPRFEYVALPLDTSINFSCVPLMGAKSFSFF